MPDGFGDGMSGADLARWTQGTGQHGWDHPAPNQAAATARLCKIIGLSRTQALGVLGKKRNKESYDWIDRVAYGDRASRGEEVQTERSEG